MPILTPDLQSTLRKAIGMNPYQAYQQTQTQTANPGELVLMLYRGATRFVALAIDALEARDIQASHTKLVQAQAVITELKDTLDMTRGGEIAVNLGQIYEYMNTRLVKTNVDKDPEPAREVLKLLRELLPAWEQAVRQTAAGSLVGAAR